MVPMYEIKRVLNKLTGETQVVEHASTINSALEKLKQQRKDNPKDTFFLSKAQEESEPEEEEV